MNYVALNQNILGKIIIDLDSLEELKKSPSNRRKI